MAEIVYPGDHAQVKRERDEASQALMALVDRFNEVTRDRDQWKAQHENLLAIYRAQTEELAKLRASTASEGQT